MDAIEVVDDRPVMFAGDWHGNPWWTESVLRNAAANGCGLVIQLGDFGYWPKELPEGPAFLAMVSEVAEELGLEVWVVPGNHEDYDWLGLQPADEHGRIITGPHVYALPRGFRFTINGVSFVAVGGAVSVDKATRVKGRSWWPQEKITQEEGRQLRDQATHADVMLTHDAPAGVATPMLPRADFIRWVGTKIALEADTHQWRVRRIADAHTPKFLLHGHFHEFYRDVLRSESWPDGRDYTCNVVGLAADGDHYNARIMHVDPDAILTEMDGQPEWPIPTEPLRE